MRKWHPRVWEVQFLHSTKGDNSTPLLLPSTKLSCTRVPYCQEIHGIAVGHTTPTYLFLLLLLNTIYCKMHKEQWNPEVVLLVCVWFFFRKPYSLTTDFFPLKPYTFNLQCFKFKHVEWSRLHSASVSITCCSGYSPADRRKQAESSRTEKEDLIQVTYCLNNRKLLLSPSLLKFFHGLSCKKDHFGMYHAFNTPLLQHNHCR